MKYIFTIIVILNSALGFNQEAVFFVQKPIIKFSKVNEGVTLSHYFVFENNGNKPLKIDRYEVECDCTALEFPKYEIQPGAMDSVRLTFDTNGKYYFQDRTVVVYSNSKKKKTTLRFKVHVVPKED
jgi:hypothetical protein